MYYNFFIHSSLNGHLGCLHVLSTVNIAAVNTGVHVSFKIVYMFYYIIPKYFIFEWLCHLVFFFHLFIWLRWVSVVAHRIFVAASRLLSSCGTWVPECPGSAVVSRRLGCPKACGISVSQLGIEPVCPALEGEFLTTGPPGKSQSSCILNFNFHVLFASI